MKPLSLLLYFKNNLKSVLPVFVSIAVAVFLVYFYALLSATFIKMENVATFDLMNKYNVAYTSDSKPLPASFLKNVKEADGSGVDRCTDESFRPAIFQRRIGQCIDANI